MNVTARRFVRITVALVALSATGACANTCSSNKEEEKKVDVCETRSKTAKERKAERRAELRKNERWIAITIPDKVLKQAVRRGR